MPDDDNARASANGHADVDDDEDLPLDADEAAAGAATADEPVTETLAERVMAVIADLPGVERREAGDEVVFLAGGRPFAVLADARLEAALDPQVSAAALRTPDTTQSARGRGWIAFAPTSLDRFALDRAEAWVRSAHRRVTPGG